MAHRRYTQRIEKGLNEIVLELDKLKDKLSSIDDIQYKIINETILTLYQTIEGEKIEFLKKVITNAVDQKDIKDHESSIISRIIRDISAQEASFFVKNKFKTNEYNRIIVENVDENQSSNAETKNRSSLTIVFRNNDYAYVKNKKLILSVTHRLTDLVNGLVYLGLLVPGESIPGGNNYIFSPISEKVRNLLS